MPKAEEMKSWESMKALKNSTVAVSAIINCQEDGFIVVGFVF